MRADSEESVESHSADSLSPDQLHTYKPSLVRRAFAKLWILIILQFLHNVCGAVRMAILFPYVRTLVHCDTPVDFTVPRDSELWSGSLYCGDKDYVARSAQQMYGIAMGTNLILQFLFISTLGAFGDTFGRKPILILSMIGYSIEWYRSLSFGRLSHFCCLSKFNEHSIWNLHYNHLWKNNTSNDRCLFDHD